MTTGYSGKHATYDPRTMPRVTASDLAQTLVTLIESAVDDDRISEPSKLERRQTSTGSEVIHLVVSGQPFNITITRART